MKKPCGCCEGNDVVTPQEIINRPGLSAIAYRVGTHATFLESMLARLSSAAPVGEDGNQLVVQPWVESGGDGGGKHGGGHGGQGSGGRERAGYAGEGGRGDKSEYGEDYDGRVGGGHDRAEYRDEGPRSPKGGYGQSARGGGYNQGDREQSGYEQRDYEQRGNERSDYGGGGRGQSDYDENEGRDSYDQRGRERDEYDRGTQGQDSYDQSKRGGGYEQSQKGGGGYDQSKKGGGYEQGKQGGYAKRGGYEGVYEPKPCPPPSSARLTGPLAGLRTRQPDDASIALLDAWATVADVLTFYQERVANEGYLRTAVERRSVVELARLLGYRPRPGVASSAHLAFTLQEGFNVNIPEGTPAMTTPGPGELPQTFETSVASDARAEWNELRPRRTQPQRINEVNASNIRFIHFAGVDTRLKLNDRLLLVFDERSSNPVLRRVAAVEEDQENKRTKVTLQVEEFTAAKFVIDVKNILGSLTADCEKKLNALASVKKLRDELEKSHPLSDFSKFVKAVTGELAPKITSGQATVKDLNAVHDAATKQAAALSALLDKPDADVPLKVQPVVGGFSAQQGRAEKVDLALRGFTLPGEKDPVATPVGKLFAAEVSLKDEAAATDDFKALAQAMNALRAKLSSNTGAVSTAASAAVKNTPIPGDDELKKLAETDVDKKRVEELIQIRKDFQAAANVSPADQTAAVESALAVLHGKTADNKDLRELLTAIRDQHLRPALTTIKDSLVAAAALTQHSELLITPETKDALKPVSDALQALQTTLAATPLRQLPAAFKQVADAAPATDLVLLKARFLELNAALERSPGDAPRDALKAAVNATPPVVTDANAQKHLDAIKLLADSVKAAPDTSQAIAASVSAAQGLTQRAALIDVERKAAAAEQGCFGPAATLFAALQNDFTAHYKNQFFIIGEKFRRRIPPNSPNRQKADEALALLSAPLDSGSLVTLTDLVAPINNVSASIELKRKEVPAGDTLLLGWFDGLLADINAQLKFIEESQAEPPVTTPREQDAFLRLKEIATNLLKTSTQGALAPQDLKAAFRTGSDALARSLVVLKPGLGDKLLEGWGNIKVDLPVVSVYAFRVRASLFGFNAPKSRVTDVTAANPNTNPPTPQKFIVRDGDDPAPLAETNTRVSLDAAYDLITQGSWVAVQLPGESKPAVYAKAEAPNAGVGIERYGMTGKTTEIALALPEDPRQLVEWFDDDSDATDKLTFTILRGTLVWAQAEQLALAEEPIEESIGPAPEKKTAGQPPAADAEKKKGAANSVLLDGYFSGLKPGRFVALTGERTQEDVGVDGVVATELALIAAVEQSLDDLLPGDTLHTRLVFANSLQHQYKRETVRINANIAHATHGATQKEVLGSGDGSRRFQSFKLSKLPLTYLSEPTPSGARSTLAVRVNDILWREADNLAALSPNDRKYVINIEDDGATSVVFGDGVHGSRLPTGTENVRAVYRSGIGKPGNVVPKKIGVLPSPPLGVTAVSNPTPAAGGANPETRDQARRNAPAAVLALDRLVSVRDYADFARTFAGIAKASASLAGNTVAVTVAGVDDTPVDPASDLVRNLKAALEQFGDPHQPVSVGVRTLQLLVLQMNLSIHPDHDAAVVTGRVRAALLDAFGFDQQELGEPVVQSRVVAVAQRVPGVEFIDVEFFGAVREGADPDPQQITADIEKLVEEQLNGVPAKDGRPARPPGPAEFVLTRPDEIAYFSPELPETIVLKEIAPEVSQ